MKLNNGLKMRKTFFAVLVLMALTACKNVKETAEMIDLPRAETPDSVAKAMDGFFEQAATDSMDIHSVMIVRDGRQPAPQQACSAPDDPLRRTAAASTRGCRRWAGRNRRACQR